MTYGVHAAAKGIFQEIRSDTNHGSLLKNTTYTGPPRLRYFQVVPTQTTAAHCTIGEIFYVLFKTRVGVFYQIYNARRSRALYI
jgi:hypothetical protein